MVYGPIRLPDAVRGRIDPARTPGREEFLRALGWESIHPDELQRWTDRGALLMVAYEREQRKKHALYASITGVCFITVTNRRTKPATQVALRLPRNTVAVRVERDDQHTEDLATSPRVALGTLLPREQVRITTWGGYEPRPELSLREMHVSDADGEGIIRTGLMVGPAWAWLVRNWWLAVLIGYVVLRVLSELAGLGTTPPPERAMPSAPTPAASPSASAAPTGSRLPGGSPKGQ